MTTYDIAGYLIGLDLGQSSDYTAIAVLKQRLVPIGGTTRALVGFDLYSGASYEDVSVCEARYDCIHLDRWRGRSYNDVLPVVPNLEQRLRVADNQERMAAGRFTNDHPVIDLLVDRTGVGRAVLDTLRAGGLNCVGITIHGGDAVTRDDGDFRVPKRDLVGTLQVLLQNQRLKIAEELPLASVLSQELRNFRAKISLGGHDSYGAGDDWREGNHDDLVLATAMAAWYAERDANDGIRPASGALADYLNAQYGR